MSSSAVSNRNVSFARGLRPVLAALLLGGLVALVLGGVARALPPDPPVSCNVTTDLDDAGNYFEGSDARQR